MCSENGELELGNAINIDKWIAEHKASFVPPICNKLMYGAGQLKVMFVGGPNTRKDYHIEEGEEFFYMVEGDMCLKVMEQGKPKDVVTREGEIFLLPCHIPHSPQRKENTIGLVIERKRFETEKDCLRWYCEDGTTILYEEWFHCTNLGKDLVPIVNNFFASNEYKTGKPGGNLGKPPFQIDVTTKMHQPFSLKKWLTDNRDEIKMKGSKVVFQSQQTKLVIYGKGDINNDGNQETWLWQFEGCAMLNCDSKEQELTQNSAILIPCGKKFSCHVLEGAYTILVMMNPPK